MEARGVWGRVRASGGNGDRGGSRGGRGSRGRGHGNTERPVSSSEGQPQERCDSRGSGDARGRAGRGDKRPRKTFEERRQERLDSHDIVPSRPKTDGKFNSKQGSSGREVELCVNYFRCEKKTDWAIYHYRVDFLPDDMERDTRAKKKLLRVHEKTVGAYMFDGCSLYVSHRLRPDPMELTSIRDTDQKKIVITVRLVAELAPTDPMYIQIYNIIVRKCLELMGMEEIGRNFYDPKQKTTFPMHRLEVWPGFITSMRNHEHDILLAVETTSKVIRDETCLQIIKTCNYDQERIKAELIGSIVMTHYNRLTYRVDDIDFQATPLQTFDKKDGTTTTFVNYFRTQYNLNVTDTRQPLLLSRPTKKDFHRGQSQSVKLIPEFCRMTGLTQEMRDNFRLMQTLATKLNYDPDKRVSAVRDFMGRLRSTEGIRDELTRWGLQFNNEPVRVKGRILNPEKIVFGAAREQMSENGDWTRALRNIKMISSVPLKHWAVICPARNANVIGVIVADMKQVSQSMGFIMSPLESQNTIHIPDVRIATYLDGIEKVIAINNQRGIKLQLVFIILHRMVRDVYAAVKKKCYVDYGVASQCFIAGKEQKGKSVATKVAIQINAKLGGEPWSLQMPFKTHYMVVGFDVYHCGKRKEASIGAMVATTNIALTKYYSCVSFHSNKEELSSNLCSDITKCLFAYRSINNALPARIFMYRDGVGDGQLTYVYDTELQQLMNAIKGLYTGNDQPMPRFSYIVVTKKINTRIFLPKNNSFGNPVPGTIVDDVITLPERYDFYMISQDTRVGTVSPTSYNVLHDSQSLIPDRMQMFTYKLCHLYFNWSGTVKVPAPCMYAHKLAYLTGIALRGHAAHESLSHYLYYL